MSMSFLHKQIQVREAELCWIKIFPEEDTIAARENIEIIEQSIMDEWQLQCALEVEVTY